MTTENQQTAIGKTPKDWKIVKAKEVFSLEYGKGLPEKRRVFGKYPVVGSNGVVGYHNQALVSGPGIVVGRKGTIGAISWIESDFWPIDTTYYVKLKKNNVSLKWLFFKLSHLNLERFNLSDVVPGLKRDLVYNMKFSLPPLPEQRRIVEALSSVDNAIQRVDEAIGKTERLKKGLMQKLLTEGIGHKEFEETKIGKIPKAWKVRKVRDLFDVKTGTTPSTKQRKYWEAGTVNWMTPTDLSKLNDQIHIGKSERKITGIAMKETNLTLMPKSSIIISTRAPVGYVAILEEAATFNQECKGLIPKRPEETCSEFYCYYLLSKKYVLENLSGGSTFKELSKKRLESFNTPFLLYPEQKKIAEILSTVDYKLGLDRKRKGKLERIKRGLMNDLLTGRRRVKVAM